MKNSIWISAFFLVLAIDLVAVYSGNESIRYFSKPLLMMVLLGYFASASSILRSILKKWLVLALVFSWLGDVFLLFESREPLFFLLGLSSFLIAHIFYIVFFQAIRIRESIPGNILLLLVVVIYYTTMITILSPYLENMKLPVRIYGVVISFMLLMALHTGFIKNKKSLKMIIGAVLFVISDSVLAFNKFYSTFEYSGILIMLTYGVGQFLIADGAIGYIRSSVTDDLPSG